MSSSSIAKNFEQKFRVDWKRSFPDGFVFRLNDQMSGFKNVSQNPSDFICYSYPHIWFCEVKTHAGSSIPFQAMVQYDRLLKYVDIEGCFCGFIVWFYEKDEDVIYLPVETVKKLKKDGEKSFGLRHLDNPKYPSYRVPTLKKKQVFRDSDYSVLVKYLTENEEQNQNRRNRKS